jgi:hypothetical protein
MAYASPHPQTRQRSTRDMARPDVRVGVIVERAGGVFLSRRHFRRQAGAINAHINNRMYDDRQNERAGNKYQYFRVESIHLVVPIFAG